MKTTSLLQCVLVFCALFFLPGVANAQESQNPERLRRADSFFGFHTDFHAMKTDRNIGENTTPEMINAIIDMIGPDYIEVDTKGHFGVSSYPTKVGNHADNIVGDPLRVWRDVTAQRGVALYGHHSGVWDNFAIEKNPEWAAVLNPQGRRSPSIASIFGPYLDQLLIPQLIELGMDYGLDGVWIDGNVWSCVVDHSEIAEKTFKEETGLDAPKAPGDPSCFPWMRFQREAFRNSLRHVIREVREKVPGLQIADNWAFTEQMPEPVSIDVDYISGDMCGYNCVNVARNEPSSRGLRI